MTEAFLVLLAGGVMLAAFISDPREVTVNWLRLAGVIALAMAALAACFYCRRGGTVQREWVMFGILFIAILGEIGGIHMPIVAIGRPFALVAAIGGMLLGERLALGTTSTVGLISA